MFPASNPRLILNRGPRSRSDPGVKVDNATENKVEGDAESGDGVEKEDMEGEEASLEERGLAHQIKALSLPIGLPQLGNPITLATNFVSAQVWSLSLYKVSRQLIIDDLNQAWSVSQCS